MVTDIVFEISGCKIDDIYVISNCTKQGFFKLFPEGVKSKILYPFMILNMHLKG